jgi:hypothetical protein
MSEALRLDPQKLIAHAVNDTTQFAAIRALGIEHIETDTYWIRGEWRVGHPRIWRPAGATENLQTGEWHNIPEDAPILSDFIREANKQRLRVIIEVKPSDADIYSQVACDKLLAACTPANIITSLDTDYLLALRQSGWQGTLIVVTDSIISERAIRELAEVEINITVGIWRITRRFTERIKANQLDVLAFIINSKSDAHRAQVLCGDNVMLYVNNWEELLRG